MEKGKGKSWAESEKELYEGRKRAKETYEQHEKEGIPDSEFTHVGLYSGRSQIRRLLLAAEVVPDSHKNYFLKEAYLSAKMGKDTALFKRVVSRISGRLGPVYNMDNAWCDAVDAHLMDSLLVLFARLRVSPPPDHDDDDTQDLMTAYNDLGDSYFSSGQLPEALESYARARDFCFLPEHLVDSYMKSIPVAIELEQYALVASIVSKAQQQLLLLPLDYHHPLQLTLSSKLQCAAGLAHLAAKDFKLAADMFVRAGPDLGTTSYEEVVVPQDVALYAVLCSLATYSWTELEEKVFDDIRFHDFCKLLPVLNSLIEGFRMIPGDVCWSWLGNMKSSLMQDIYLHHHVDTLCSQIRGQILFNYLTRGPGRGLSRVDLKLMAFQFDTTVDEVEMELQCLIRTNKIQASISKSFAAQDWLMSGGPRCRGRPVVMRSWQRHGSDNKTGNTKCTEAWLFNWAVTWPT